MSLESNKFKIIFLIDVSVVSRQNKLDENVDDTINLIRSCVVKLLLHFTTLVKDENKQLQWGFKFYNVHNQRYTCRNIFRDVNIKQFEEFENDLEQLLEDSFSHISQPSDSQNSQPFSKEHHSDNRRTKVGKGSYPHIGYDRSDTLATQIKDIIYDFQWQGPDISSPVKFVRRKSFRAPAAASATRDESLNAVFLVSDCPHSARDVAGFSTSDEVPSSKGFLSEFLPTSVFQQFHVAKLLRLFWIDTDALHKERAVDDFSGVSIVNEALSHVGGCVIPANCLVQTGQLSSSNILQNLTLSPSQVSTACPLLPISSIVEHYTNPSRSLPNCIVHATLKVIAPTQDENCIEIAVRLQPIVQTKRTAPLKVHGKKESTSSSSLQLHTSSNTQINLTVTNQTNSQQQQPMSKDPADRSIRSANQEINDEDGPSSAQWKITSIATVGQSALPLTCLESSVVYMVSADGEGSTEQQDAWTKLMSSMASKRRVLAVNVSHPSASLTFTAVLQPLTSVSATLTTLKSSMTFWLDKVRCFKETPADVPKEENAEIARFVKGACDTLTKDLPKIDFSRRDSENCAPVPLAEKFNPNFMSAFFMPEAKSQQQDKIMGILRENETHKAEREKEKQLLRKLQQHYLRLKAQKRPKLQDAPVHATKRSPRKNAARSPRKQGRSPRKMSRSPRKGKGRQGSPRKKLASRGASPSKKFSQAIRRVRSSTGPTRTDLIFKRSKEALQQAAQQKGVEEERHAEKAKESSTAAGNHSHTTTDFRSEEDLTKFSRATYEKVVNGETELLSGAHMITNLVLHYHQKAAPQNAQSSSVEFVSSHLLLTNKTLRAKYKGQEENVDDKVRELTLQAVLYMEVSSLQVDQLTEDIIEARTTQIAGMLRTLSFLKDPVYLSKFLQEVLLDGYCDTLPRLLAAVYEELLQPLPPQLAHVNTEDGSEAMDLASVHIPSVASNVSSAHSSVCPPSNRSLRDRKPRRYSSFQIEPKRQIAMQIPKGAKKVLSKPSRSSARLSTKKPSTVSKPAQQTSEAKKVRRNLFDEDGGDTKLERRQSVAVMETSSAHNLQKTPKKRTPAASGKTPKVHHSLKTKMVTETPRHKQKLSNIVWRRLEKERQRTHTVGNDDITVVQESPEKAVKTSSKANNAASSPSKRRASIQLARKTSFYSAGPTCRARSTLSYEKATEIATQPQDEAKIEKLEQRMREPLLSPGWNEALYKPGDLALKSTPRRIHPKTLFAQLKSPSPHKPSRGVMTLNFDTPSKHTRARSLFLSPELETEVSGAGVVASPRKGICVSDTPQKIMGTPKKFGVDQYSASPAKRAHLLLTPRRDLEKVIEGSPLRSGRLLLSPMRKTETPGKQKISPLDTESRGFDLPKVDLFASPARSTRSQINKVQENSMTKARTNLSSLFSPVKNIASPRKPDGTPGKKNIKRIQLSSAPVDTAPSAMFTQMIFSRVNELQGKVEERKEETRAIRNPFANTTPTKDAEESVVEEEPVFKTPPSRGKRHRSKSPSPRVSPEINQWPRRKSRAAMNRSPVSFTKGSTSSSSSDSNTVAITPEIERKVRNTRKNSVSPSMASDKTMEKENTCGFDSTSPLKGKRKFESTEDFVADGSGDVKRRRTLRSSAFSSVSQGSEYFGSNEVFIESEDACDLPPMANSGMLKFHGFNRKISGVFHSESSQGFPIQNEAKISAARFSFESDSNSNAPSPVFASPIVNKHLAVKKMASDEKMETDGSGPDSPVFGGKIELEKGTFAATVHRPSPRKAALASPFSPLKSQTLNMQIKNSPMATKKSPKNNFSPLSSRGLLTLIESPMFTDGKKKTVVKDERRTPPKSKKMLYN